MISSNTIYVREFTFEYDDTMAGQTLSEIKGLLATAGLNPQHRFGQNFLIDLNLMRKLVDAGSVEPADVVLEVGPGTGSLTEMLLDRGAHVISVEIDRGFQELLAARLGDHHRFALISGDALETKHALNPQILQKLDEIKPEPNGVYKLVANLPYQIATPLLIDLLLIRVHFERLTCTIQREVGERLAATASTDAYGPVSVIVQTLADVTLLAILPPSVFWPRPKVESVMLTIRPKPAQALEVKDVGDFVAFVQLAFAHRRKMLRRLLKDAEFMGGEDAFLRAGVSLDARPEELSPAAWVALHRELRSRSA